MDNKLKNLLFNNGVRLKKAYGQNFLTDESLLAEIAEKAGIKSTDAVLEIGCGAGALTKVLSEKAGKVVGYEIDERLKPVLKETLKDCGNVTLEFKDIMKETPQNLKRLLGEKYKIVANLPYYITTPVIMKFLENSDGVLSMTVMVQEEVAERFAAKAGDSDYGAITVGITLRGSAEIVMRVGREKFFPVPNVDSAVVRIDIDKDKFKGTDLAAIRETVKAAFSGRRKTLENNLINAMGLKRETAKKCIEDCGFSPLCRGETLSAEDFVLLTEKIKEARNG